MENLQDKVYLLQDAGFCVNKSEQTARLSKDFLDDDDSKANQYASVIKSKSNIEIQIDVLPSYENDEDDENSSNCWTVVDININYENVNIENLQKFINIIQGV